MFEACPFARPVEHELHGAGAERGAALRGKDVIAGRMEVLAAHPPQGADFNPAEPVVAI